MLNKNLKFIILKTQGWAIIFQMNNRIIKFLKTTSSSLKNNRDKIKKERRNSIANSIKQVKIK